MLECGKNFKGSIKETCAYCNETDDENHRLNFCKQFRDINLYNNNCKVNYDDIYSSDIDVVKKLITQIEKVWNVKTAHGTVHKYTFFTL